MIKNNKFAKGRYKEINFFLNVIYRYHTNCSEIRRLNTQTRVLNLKQENITVWE